MILCPVLEQTNCDSFTRHFFSSGVSESLFISKPLPATYPEVWQVFIPPGARIR